MKKHIIEINSWLDARVNYTPIFNLACDLDNGSGHTLEFKLAVANELNKFNATICFKQLPHLPNTVIEFNSIEDYAHFCLVWS